MEGVTIMMKKSVVWLMVGLRDDQIKRSNKLDQKTSPATEKVHIQREYNSFVTNSSPLLGLEQIGHRYWPPGGSQAIRAEVEVHGHLVEPFGNQQPVQEGVGTGAVH